MWLFCTLICWQALVYTVQFALCTVISTDKGLVQLWFAYMKTVSPLCKIFIQTYRWLRIGQVLPTKKIATDFLPGLLFPWFFLHSSKILADVLPNSPFIRFKFIPYHLCINYQSDSGHINRSRSHVSWIGLYFTLVEVIAYTVKGQKGKSPHDSLGVGSKAADAKSRKRPMLKRPMLLKAADVA